MYCAMRSPQSLAHRYCKGHEIPLTYPPVEDHPEDFYCDICEEEMNPNLPLYHCQKCKYRNSFHLDCISRNDYYANVWSEGTETVSYHKHPPLTFVRRKKTPNGYNTTPVVDKTDKYEKLIIDRKVFLVDDEGKPLKKFAYPDDQDSEDEMESVNNDMTRLMASERVGFGTNSLLKQWMDTYRNADYDYDPYEKDM
uniref:C1-like protein n=1 Tax=Tanacetum cinerariifolium TaxID=118510 RepID=A0A699LAV9_TANCI|nr:C1-like protein [Tanacetum cinerariifolium]